MEECNEGVRVEECNEGVRVEECNEGVRVWRSVIKECGCGGV